MEVRLGASKGRGDAPDRTVLILVLVEVRLGVDRAEANKARMRGLNPCFGGS